MQTTRRPARATATTIPLALAVAAAGCAVGIAPGDGHHGRDGGGPLPDGGSYWIAADAAHDAGASDAAAAARAEDAVAATSEDAEPADAGLAGCVDRDHDGAGVGYACAAVDCDDANPAVHPGASEVCNGVDDNCNGAVDEGFGPETCGAGACQRTVQTCAGGVAATCSPGAPSPEACNGVDDDCNGVPDDGLRVAVVSVPYQPTLATLAADCNGAVETSGYRCNYAINRFCHARGACSTSGFGPVGIGGGQAALVCVGDATFVDVAPAGSDFATLRAIDPGCDGSAQGATAGCATAIHAYCRAQGHASGFGPVDWYDHTVTVTCVDGPVATTPVTYPALARFAPACDGAREAWGPDCAAAAHALCASMGHTSGYGPLRDAGAGLAVVCVGP